MIHLVFHLTHFDFWIAAQAESWPCQSADVRHDGGLTGGDGGDGDGDGGDYDGGGNGVMMLMVVVMVAMVMVVMLMVVMMMVVLMVVMVRVVMLMMMVVSQVRTNPKHHQILIVTR